MDVPLLGKHVGSFGSFQQYANALAATPSRLTDRFFDRSNVKDEISTIRARSKHDMKKRLTWWDLSWLTVGGTIGAGIFVLSGVEAHNDTGPAVVVSYIIAGFSAMLAAFCFTELGIEIPVAGGCFAFIRVELGDFVAFIAAGYIILGGIAGGATIARGWASYLATLCNHNSDDFRIYIPSFAEGYNLLDPVAVAAIIVAGTIASLSTKGCSYINWIGCSVNFVIILFIIIAGFLNGDPSNLQPFTPYGMKGILTGASVVFFAFLGFGDVCTVAEETKKPERDIPIGILFSMTVITIVYCLMCLSLCLLQSYVDIDVNAPFSSAFANVLGWKWAQNVVALGALISMSTTLLMAMLADARYIAHMARTRLIPSVLALVNPRTGTPVNATVICIVTRCILAFFTDLEVLSNLLSMCALLTIILVAMSLIVRRHYVPGVTLVYHQRLLILFLALITGSSIAIAAYWGITDGNAWVGYIMSVPVWFLATFAMALFVPKARKPMFWGVPFVPWVPSLSILTCTFLMGSIDKNTYIRFGVWTALMAVYYVFYGLHSSYDGAQEVDAT